MLSRFENKSTIHEGDCKMDNTNFIDLEGHIIKSSMVDEHQLVKIDEKAPILKNIGKIVRGDTNSNILTFEIGRYYDGVDLIQKNIKFIIKNSHGIYTEPAVNLQYNDDFLRFSWILSYADTTGGTAIVAIQFYGTTDNNQNYSLKTTTFTIKIEESLDATDITVVNPENWVVDIENRLYRLESNDNFETDPINFNNFN